MAGSPTALQYLDKAVGTLRQLGLLPDKKGEVAPVVALLNQISELEPDEAAQLLARMPAEDAAPSAIISTPSVSNHLRAVADAMSGLF